MNRLIGSLLVICVLLSGCDISEDIKPLSTLQETLRCGSLCEFDARIYAEYVETQYCFVLHCTRNPDGSVRFALAEPESIRGVTGTINETGGELTYDDAILTFPLQAEGALAPVCAPWFLLRSIDSGLIRFASRESDLYCFTLNESYKGEVFQIEVQISEDGVPVWSEIYWDGICIIKLEISNFQIL